jgi:hypothetical protein
VFFVNETDSIHPIFNPSPSENSEEESNTNTPQSLILISVPPKTPFNPYSSPILVMRVSSDTQACPENQGNNIKTFVFTALIILFSNYLYVDDS